jgi:hypothetical protein
MKSKWSFFKYLNWKRRRCIIGEFACREREGGRREKKQFV